MKKLITSRFRLLLVALGVVAAGVVAVVAVASDNDKTHKHLKDPRPQSRAFRVNGDANRHTGPPPQKIKFYADAWDAVGKVTYRWNFDDGTVTAEQNPTHTFTKPGYYQVFLEAKDESKNRALNITGGINIITSVWPAKLWARAVAGRLTPKQQLKAVRQQSRRTAKRRLALFKAGLPVFLLGVPGYIPGNKLPNPEKQASLVQKQNKSY